MKAAVESPLMLADIAILDPELTMFVPRAVTAATGLDALAHCVEAFTDRRAHPLTSDYARMRMRLAGTYLRRAVENGSKPRRERACCQRRSRADSALAR